MPAVHLFELILCLFLFNNVTHSFFINFYRFVTIQAQAYTKQAVDSFPLPPGDLFFSFVSLTMAEYVYV
jgi:hypothetical protein